MHANSTCIACLLNKQVNNIRPFKDEKKKSDYIHKILKLLYDHGQTQSAPWLFMKIEEIYNEYYEPIMDYSAIKQKYNQYMLSKESIIEENIRKSDDMIASCIQYVCAGNFIDFGAMSEVDDSILENILQKAIEESLSKEELINFKHELSKARELVYLTDNCGEIVIDKLFMKLLKEQYPKLHITAIVRGGLALNDATMEDAREVGLTEIVDCIDNGTPMTGTDLESINETAKQVLNEADLIISKGQGNFEGLYGEGLMPYFLFLCKCELFVRRFGLKQFSSVFAREDHIKIVE
ncbi:MAG: ARMT1-like domain-containing protein [Lachnospiraceae bacterium]|nr:ARMT1-like domain-containing protein [Lachnospiraceae bacterium]